MDSSVLDYFQEVLQSLKLVMAWRIHIPAQYRILKLLITLPAVWFLPPPQWFPSYFLKGITYFSLQPFCF